MTSAAPTDAAGHDELGPEGDHHGYGDVDRHPLADKLILGMDETSAWPEVVELRAWAGDHIASALTPDRPPTVLDVGCGPGTALIDLALALAPAHPAIQCTGTDVSDLMISVATERAAAAGANATFQMADATALPFDDDHFDGARAERVLQWIPDPSRAVAELVRVCRPGAVIALLDTDWRTLALTHPDPVLTERVVAGFLQRSPTPDAGSQLPQLLAAAGVEVLDIVVRAHRNSGFIEDEMRMPGGPPAFIWTDAATSTGAITADEAAAWVDGYVAAGRDGSLSSVVTLFGTVGRVA